MEDNTLVKSSFSVTIHAPFEKVDIPSWCFTLPESEYQAFPPAYCSAGATTAPDGRRMSINVEILVPRFASFGGGVHGHRKPLAIG